MSASYPPNVGHPVEHDRDQMSTGDTSDNSSDSEVEAEVSEPEDDEERGGEDPIDQNNIITDGRRTRGKVIDYSKIHPGDAEEEDDDDDEEYEAKDGDGDDQMRD